MIAFLLHIYQNSPCYKIYEHNSPCFRMKTTAKHLRSLVTNNVSISDDDQLRSKIRQEWTQEFMDLVQNKKSL